MFLRCSYESTSSDDSSSESSDEGSDSSEYHEAREKLPESTVPHQQVAHNKVSQPPENNSVPQQTAIQVPAVIPDSRPSPSQSATVETRLPEKPHRSPATDTAPQDFASRPLVSVSGLTPSCPGNDSASDGTVGQPTEQHKVTTSTSSSTESTSPSVCVSKTAEITKQQYTVGSGTAAPSGQSELKPAAESSAIDAVSAKQVR